MPNKEKGVLFIELLLKDKPRYLRDNLLVLKKHLSSFEPDIVGQTVDFCLERNVYNANRFVEIAQYYKLEKAQESKITAPQVQPKKENATFDIEPKHSQIAIYETIL
jgi:hypothetical protein